MKIGKRLFAGVQPRRKHLKHILHALDVAMNVAAQVYCVGKRTLQRQLKSLAKGIVG